MEELFKKAVAYVKENRKFDDVDVDYACKYMELYRCPLSMVSTRIADEIHDLMEEFSDNNDLPEGWWYNIGDEEDVFYEVI